MQILIATVLLLVTVSLSVMSDTLAAHKDRRPTAEKFTEIKEANCKF